METRRLPHDEFVKAMMAHPKVAIDFFKAHLPQTVLEKIDLSSLKLEPTSFIDEQLKKHETDLVYSIKLINQQDALLYTLVEHQSTPDPLMAFRLHYYLLQGLKRYILQNKQTPLPLPLIFPIVLYNGEDAYPYSRDIFALFGQEEALAKTIFLQPFALVDVGELPDEEISKHQWAGLMELSLCRASVRDFTKEMQQLGFLFKELQIKASDDIVKLVLKYELFKHDFCQSTPQGYKELMLNVLPPEWGSVAMNIAEAFVAEGEANALNNTRQAIELMGKGVSLEEIAQQTGLALEMLQFLREHMAH
jgi:predicted transposase/invertase (TIGR01784 family)